MIQATYLPLCVTHLPTFPIAHIGFNIPYARQFLSTPSVSFNMLQKVLVGPYGAKFIRDAKAAKRAVYVWTVNEVGWMKWSIESELDGVVTDDPKKFLEVCRDCEDEEVDPDRVGQIYDVGMREWALVVWIGVLSIVFGWLFRWRYGHEREGPRGYGEGCGVVEGIDNEFMMFGLVW
jgi:phosphatidylglycerol phospholipase C